MSTDKHDDKGHGAHPVTIIVNTREKTVEDKEISFEEIVALAFENPPTGENVGFTILWRRGHGNKDGSLVAGETIKVKDGMVFNVTPTDRS